MARLTFAGVRRGAAVLGAEGPRGFAQRAVRRAYKALDAGTLEFPLLPGLVADSATIRPAEPVPLAAGAVPAVGWLCAPPSLGSGGHTTMFRMIRGLEEAGIRCVLFLYDRHGGDVVDHARTLRQGWPEIRADVRDAAGGIGNVDACFATSWDSAHVLAVRAAPTVRRLYFIQDYEPYFYPRGSEYALAEDSYRFGFRHVALGEMVAGTIRDEIGVECETVPFGNDASTYRYQPGVKRSGVVFYSKPDVPRRGYVHVRLALEEFHRRHPEQEIHAYGAKVTDLPIPVTWHGRMWPTELNDLYNRTLGGIAMSFTNITLVAGEMLAAGNIPVLNDSPFARAVVTSPHIAWARPTPHAIADALCEVVEHPDPDARARAVAGTRQIGWDETKAALVSIVQRELGTTLGSVRPAV